MVNQKSLEIWQEKIDRIFHLSFMPKLKIGISYFCHDYRNAAAIVPIQGHIIIVFWSAEHPSHVTALLVSSSSHVIHLKLTTELGIWPDSDPYKLCQPWQ